MNHKMPSSQEAEQSLLGSIMLYRNSLPIVMEESLQVDDFYYEHHRKIFKCILMLMDESKTVDITTLTDRLKDLNQLDSIGGIEYLIRLQDLAVTSASTRSYIEIVQKKSTARRLIETAHQIVNDGLNGALDYDSLLDNAEKSVLNITRNRKASDFRSSKEVIDSVLEHIRKMNQQKTKVTGIVTGFGYFDNVTSGLQRGDLIILAARPSVGKTAFALNCATNVALKNEGAVAIFSLEMPAEQLITRMIAARGQIKISNLKNGILDAKDWGSLQETCNELSKAKIFMDDSPTIKVAQIFSKCRKLKSEHGLSLIVIDYLQLISGSGRNNENRQNEVSEISRNLKALARDLQVPVIALSQLSRNVEQRSKSGDARPMLSDLRESGSIEQDADIVMFLYRENYQKKEEEKVKDENDCETVELLIAKHRNGATGKVLFKMNLPYNKFYATTAKDIEEGS